MKIQKKILFLLLVMFTSVLFAQETVEAVENAETVENTETVEAVETAEAVETVETVKADEYDEYTITTPKKKNTGFGNKIVNYFTSGTKEFYEFGTTELNYATGINKIKSDESVLTIIEDSDYAGVGVQMSGAFYYVFFDSAARNKLISAGNLYLKEFEEKKLVRKDSKTMRKYGQGKTKVYFGSLKAKAVNNSEPFTNFGYHFINNSPYFTIQCLEAENEKFKESDVYPKRSNIVELNFTKAQLKQLMDFLSEENINNCFLQLTKYTAIDEY